MSARREAGSIPGGIDPVHPPHDHHDLVESKCQFLSQRLATHPVRLSIGPIGTAEEGVASYFTRRARSCRQGCHGPQGDLNATASQLQRMRRMGAALAQANTGGLSLDQGKTWMWRERCNARQRELADMSRSSL
jgi:hypothetical protein